MNIAETIKTLAEGRDVAMTVTTDHFAPRVRSGDKVRVSATSAIEPGDLVACFSEGVYTLALSPDLPAMPVAVYAITEVQYDMGDREA